MTTLTIEYHQLGQRRVTQQAAAVYPGVSGAGLGGTLNPGHVARADILFRVVNDLIARPSALSPATHCLRAPPPPSCKPDSA